LRRAREEFFRARQRDDPGHHDFYLDLSRLLHLNA
jgi:hypothetical protein